MNIRIEKTTQAHTNVAIRCPHCGHFGTFEDLFPDLGIHRGNAVRYYLGIKRCPNIKCRGYLFFIQDVNNSEILLTSPTESIPLDKEKIPENVLRAIEEAIKCHSESCYIAAAIMIRKTLEEICFERGANGNNLKDRLINLGGKILIPKELLSGMDDLRLLGNDAAHIEAKTFNEIGKEEIEISLDFTKEILKAVYQYENLLAKLKKLKEKKNEINEA